MYNRLRKFQSHRRKGYIKYTALSSALIFSLFYYMAGALAATPGTFAWFTSETNASGTIQTATTSDLLKIEASDVDYRKNCTISNSITIKNISELETTVTVAVATNKGDKVLVSKHLNPGKSVTTNPDEITKLNNKCSLDHIEYKIKAFNYFVDETYTVAVDKDKMKQPADPPKKDESTSDKAEPEKATTDTVTGTSQKTSNEDTKSPAPDQPSVEEPSQVTPAQEEPVVKENDKEDSKQEENTKVELPQQ
ncbi:hypothetical protein RCG23_13495 [Neobacillus sp. PS3-34]|uniref:hypothetical protein n=1 Tax=Neobacillus sp. PS3-34 TaxID=3070678 RepID=UPI0027DEDF3E|nr:hypothetical protein [Neobacillus sp. PS3-34]WML46664.1 hypothetical protein RCG23_13495 [Neobacillus sp. PS3-34]